MDNFFLIKFTKCNFVQLLSCQIHYKTLHNKYNNISNKQNGCTPCAMSNVMMTIYTTCNNAKLMHFCNKCHPNKNKPQNATYVVYQTPS